MEWKRTYGIGLKRLRRERGITQEKLAKAIDRSADAVARYEAEGDRNQPMPPELHERAATRLGFTSAVAMLAELEARAASHGPGDTSRATLDEMPIGEVITTLEALLFERGSWPETDESAATPLVPRTLYVSAGTASVVASFLPRIFRGVREEQRPKLARVVVLHLSKAACRKLREASLLDADFQHLLDTNLRQLEEGLSPYGVRVERRSTNNVPPWHGFLLGDHLLRGRWQVGASGLLDVHTALEHVPLQADPAAHMAFLAPFFPMFARPAELDLGPGEYAIFGSGPLAVRGMRDPHDVDIIVTTAAWNRLVSRGFAPVPHDDDHKILIDDPAGQLEILRKWHPDIAPTNELIERAEWIHGLPFVCLDHVEAWKKAFGRPKDLCDLAILDAYRKRLDKPPISPLPVPEGEWDPRWGRAFYQLLQDKGWTRTRLARETEQKVGDVNQVVQGGVPSYDKMKRFAKALGFDSVDALRAELRARTQRPAIPGLPVGTKIEHVVRAISARENRGETLFVYAGIGDVTRTILSRLVEGDADAPRPTIQRVVCYRIAQEMLRALTNDDELAPSFGEALHANLANLRALAKRAGLVFEERDFPGFPNWHGYVVGDHAFVGRWELDAAGHWHADGRAEHVVRGKGHPHEESIWALAR